MDDALKKGVVLVVVLFIGWLLFTDPSHLADLAKSLGSVVWNGLVTLFKAISSFLDAVTS